MTTFVKNTFSPYNTNVPLFYNLFYFGNSQIISAQFIRKSNLLKLFLPLPYNLNLSNPTYTTLIAKHTELFLFSAKVTKTEKDPRTKICEYMKESNFYHKIIYFLVQKC